MSAAYECTRCREMVVNPFGTRPETPDICPTCYRLEHPRFRIDPHELNAERMRLSRARKRAEKIAADLEAHPAALEACVDGLLEDVHHA